MENEKNDNDRITLIDVLLFAHVADVMENQHLVSVVRSFPHIMSKFNAIHKMYFSRSQDDGDVPYPFLGTKGGEKLSRKSSSLSKERLAQIYHKADLQNAANGFNQISRSTWFASIPFYSQKAEGDEERTEENGESEFIREPVSPRERPVKKELSEEEKLRQRSNLRWALFTIASFASIYGLRVLELVAIQEAE